ncbi:unnamed protein product [Closterium sp. NIES-54]
MYHSSFPAQPLTSPCAAASAAAAEACARTATAEGVAVAAIRRGAEMAVPRKETEADEERTWRRPLIPGSSVTSQAAVSAFRTRHACLANHGAWRLDPVPRLLPWTAPSSSGWGGWQCDVAWTVNASAMSASDGGGKATVDVSTSGGGHVAWGAADKVVLQGLPAGDWRVRQAVKYRWLPHRTCGRWEDVGNSKIAELLNGKRMLIVGDSISGMLFFSLRNHLMQNFSVPEAAQEAAAAADTEGSEKLPVWDVVPDFCKASWQHGLRW